MTLRVGIAGAGIGGLTLAHALRGRGIECVVFDRDSGPEDTGGYRLHLTEAAFAALEQVVPEASMRALRSCGGGADSFRQFAVLGHRGETLVRFPIRHSGEVLLIGRRALRAILARGLEPVIRWGTPVRGYRLTKTGVVVSCGPAPGAEVDLLVAADGTGSRIASAWVGRPTARAAGITGLAGRAPLPQRIPGDLRRGLAFMVGPGGVGAFLSLHDRRGDEPEAEPPYVIWSLAARSEQIEGDLVACAHRLTRGWSRDFHALIDGAEPGSVAAFPFSFPAALQPWPIGPVTLLGDAIHPMPPTGGAGASTAILDAVHLAADLAARPFEAALSAYQGRLLRYAPAAVDEARPALLWQRRLANPLLFRAATRVALPALGVALGWGGALRSDAR